MHTLSPSPFRLLPRRRVLALTIWLAAACWMVVQPATAQDAPYDQVHRLLNAGELGAALSGADDWLAKKPQDPQMRFLRGVIRQRQGDIEGATNTFQGLIRDHPELPEPYNNLAVIHAAQGQLAKAREALETAIRLNPQYGTAHRNLGDLYLQMAAESYRAALRAGPDSGSASRQLQAVERLLNPSESR